MNIENICILTKEYPYLTSFDDIAREFDEYGLAWGRGPWRASMVDKDLMVLHIWAGDLKRTRVSVQVMREETVTFLLLAGWERPPSLSPRT